MGDMSDYYQQDQLGDEFEAEVPQVEASYVAKDSIPRVKHDKQAANELINDLALDELTFCTDLIKQYYEGTLTWKPAETRSTKQEEVLVQDMTEAHLKNTYNFVRKLASKPRQYTWLTILSTEIFKRGN